MNELFQYRQRDHRAPLEDFLTAALVGFLRLLPRERQFEFAADLLVAQTQRKAFVLLCDQSIEYRWDTQLTLPNGKRPDIVFWLDGRPAVVIENKLWSGIAIHQRCATDIDEEGPEGETPEVVKTISLRHFSQLATYGKWLRNARAGTEWVGSIVMLTHHTPPPDDFHALSDAYGAVPHVCRWHTVGSWLKDFLSYKEPVRLVGQKSAPAFMAAELAAFLQKKDLVMPKLRFSDIDALGAHLASKNALDAAFEEILATLQAACGDLIRPEDQRAIRYKNGVVHGWVYLAGDGLPGHVFFGWGLRFPEVSSWWDEIRFQLPEENHAFTYVGNDEEDFPAHDIPPSLQPSGWKVVFDGTELIAAAPLSALPAAETVSRALVLWVTAQLEALRPALNHISGS